MYDDASCVREFVFNVEPPRRVIGGLKWEMWEDLVLAIGVNRFERIVICTSSGISGVCGAMYMLCDDCAESDGEDEVDVWM
jgi:hypothetical protein